MKRYVAAVGALVASPSFALTLTDVTATLDTVETDITTVGLLLISLAAVSLSIRWVKAMFF